MGARACRARCGSTFRSAWHPNSGRGLRVGVGRGSCRGRRGDRVAGATHAREAHGHRRPTTYGERICVSCAGFTGVVLPPRLGMGSRRRVGEVTRSSWPACRAHPKRSSKRLLPVVRLRDRQLGGGGQRRARCGSVLLARSEVAAGSMSTSIAPGAGVSSGGAELRRSEVDVVIRPP